MFDDEFVKDSDFRQLKLNMICKTAVKSLTGTGFYSEREPITKMNLKLGSSVWMAIDIVIKPTRLQQ